MTTLHHPLFVFIICCLPFSFCFSQDITLNTQADVNAFDPSITTISGDLTIHTVSANNPILNLNALANLNSVGGDFRLDPNSLLNNTDGLANLNSVGGSLIISHNNQLSNLDGFANLNSVGGFLRISYNGLQNLDGLANLNSISGDLRITYNDELLNIDGLENINNINSHLEISDNNALLNLDGFINLNSVGGDLRISDNNALLNLDGFINLNSIGGDLRITYNDELLNIDGLANLNSIDDDLYIRGNTSLVSLDGLANLNSIDDDLSILTNTSLVSLDGLANLNSVGGYLRISQNYNLQNLDGLVNLNSIGDYLRISDNDLQNLDGLANLNSIGDYLLIYNNNLLTNCCAIQGLLGTPGAIGGTIDIYNNPSECSSEVEILEACRIGINVTTNPPCIGANNGSLQITLLHSSSAPYSYSWERLEDGQMGSGMSSTENFTITNLEAGTYDLMVINIEGDTAIQDSIVLIPIPGSVFEILEITTTNSSNNFNNGSITITVGGGMPSYDYSWSGISSGSENDLNQMSFTIPNLSQGEYSISVTDNSGLQQSIAISLLDETVPVFPCTQPLDVVILNDVSSSVDEVEYDESKTFFVDFVNALNIGSDADESRAAIIEWSGSDAQMIRIEMTDNLANLQAYNNYNRAYNGGTNPHEALTFGKDYLESVARPDVQRVLVLSTDGTGDQISPSLVALADQYKAAGYHIITIAFDGAFSNSYTREILRQVASIDLLAPGAPAYSQLDQDLAENIVTIYLCPIDPGSSATAYFNRDGAIDILSIAPVGGCPFPDYVDITFTVEALQQLSIPSGTPISFYYNNPALFGATPILSWLIPCAIPAGTIDTFTISLPVSDPANIFAVLNHDGSQLPPVTLPITDIDELAYSNNIDNETVCTEPLPSLQAFKYTSTPQPICNNTVIYTVDVCNISALGATSVEIMDVPPADFVLLGESLNLNGCASENANAFDIPAGCCVSITYTYDATNSPDSIYNNQDVLLSGSGGQYYNNFNGGTTSAEDVTIDGTVDCPSTIIEFSKSVNISESCEDAFVVYTFTIDNQLNIPLQGIEFSDILPFPVTWVFQPYSLSGLSIANPAISGGSATFTIDQVEANTVASFSMDAYIGDWEMDGTLSNTAALTNVIDLENGTFQTLSSNTVNTNVVASPQINDLPDTISIFSNEAAILSLNLNTDADLVWSTSGDGVFDDSTGLFVNYFPGTQDSLNGQTTIFVDATSPCGSEEAEVTIIVITPCPDISTEIAVHPISCNNENDGTATLTPNGGLLPYTYIWSNSSIDSMITGLTSGEYSVTVTDANNCTTTDSISFSNPNELTATIISTDGPCFGQNEGNIAFTNTENGIPPLLYTIDGSNFSEQTIFDQLAPGSYIAVVQDSNLCIFEQNITINEGEQLNVSLEVTQPISCNNENDGTAAVATNGGLPPYTYIWSNSSSDSIITDLGPGEYNVTVTDVNNCTASDHITLNEPSPLEMAVFSTNSLCFGDNSGSISFDEVVGGTPPYLYTIDGVSFSEQTHYNALSGGEYPLAVQDANACIIEDNLTLEEAAEIFVNLGSDTIISLGDSILIQPQHNLSVVNTFIWEGIDCINCPEVTITPTTDLAIALTIADLNGCLATDELLLGVNASSDLYVPNVFSPNGDGINDVFHPFGIPERVKIDKMSIFDRWGSLVFESYNFDPNDRSFGWDGTFKGRLLPAGVFAWYIDASFFNGEEKVLKGDVAIIR